jgi:hypothetical protein
VSGVKVHRMVAPLDPLSEAVAKAYADAMIGQHGALGARIVLAKEGVEIDDSVEVDPASALRFVAATREQRRAKAAGEAISFAEACSR